MQFTPEDRPQMQFTVTQQFTLACCLIAGCGGLVTAFGQELETNDQATPSVVENARTPSKELGNPLGEPLRELPPWSKSVKTVGNVDEVPAVTTRTGSVDAAPVLLQQEIRTALIEYVEHESGGYFTGRLYGPIEEIAAAHIKADQEIYTVKYGEGSEAQLQLVTRIRIPHATRDTWSKIARNDQQLRATAQTTFLGTGVLGLLAIVTVYANLNHAWRGKGVGILRFVAAVAILSLVGGMTTAALLSDIFLI
jgi:hypothetical protein